MCAYMHASVCVYVCVYICLFIHKHIWIKSSSLLHLTCAIARAHARTRATNSMHEKIAHTTSVWGTYSLGH